MMLQACLNGSRPPGFHPALPLTPEALAQAGRAAVRAGASELHVHPRDAAGRESLDAADVAATITALRAAVPGAAVGVSTGEWILADADRTLAQVERWTVLPDYASVNLAEAAAPALIERLHRRGMGVEAGLHSPADVRRLLALDLLPLCLRVLVEIDLQHGVAALEQAEAMLAMLPPTKPVLLHGWEATVWPLIGMAGTRGLSTRVGLEDGELMPDGTIAPDNTALVGEALKRLRPVKRRRAHDGA